ncbi:hypothetical protein ACFQU2_42400 [Siccirubricoccus deserti]
MHLHVLHRTAIRGYRGEPAVGEEPRRLGLGLAAGHCANITVLEDVVRLLAGIG